MAGRDFNLLLSNKSWKSDIKLAKSDVSTPVTLEAYYLTVWGHFVLKNPPQNQWNIYAFIFVYCWKVIK